MHLKLETLIATPFSVEVLASNYTLKTVRATIKIPFRTTKESHWWTVKSFPFLNHRLESISYKALGSPSFPSYIFIFFGFADWEWGNEIVQSRKKPSPTLFSYIHLPWMKVIRTRFASFLALNSLRLDSIEFSALTFELVSLKNQVITFVSFHFFNYYRFYAIFCSHLWLEYENHDHRHHTSNLPLQAQSTSKSHHITS